MISRASKPKLPRTVIIRETLPFYLDAFWTVFRARPYAISGQNGYTGSQADTSDVVIRTTTSLGSGVFGGTLSPAGVGSRFVVGEPISLVDNLTSQTFVIQSVTGDVLSWYPKIRIGTTFTTAGTIIDHLWVNEAHPTVNGYTVLAQFVANAKVTDAVNGPNILANGSLETRVTDATGVTGVPSGWHVIAGTNTYISGGAITTLSYATTVNHPNARTGNSANIVILSTDPSGTGIETDDVAVRPGEQYNFQIQVNDVTGAQWQLRAVDGATGTVIATKDFGGTVSYIYYKNTCSQVTMKFSIPGGTTKLRIQIRTPTGGASRQLVIDDARLLINRQNSFQDRYIIEDLGVNTIIATLGDSWLNNNTTWGAFRYALSNRFGYVPNVYKLALTGNRMDQMVTQFKTTIIPLRPAYCVWFTGTQNDLAQNRTQSQMEGDLMNFIDSCRANQITPIICGVSPSAYPTVTGGMTTCHDRNDQMRAICDQYSY